MNIKVVSKKQGLRIVRIAAIAILPIAMVSPAMGADTAPVVPISLVAPSGLPDVAPL
ncbi:MAG: hypothetical protein F2814_06010, partial [Actinobacteria bacterium]|nr:hypothetical protein [Actinomycetota bacterium]